MYLSSHPNSCRQPLPGAVELSVSAALSAAMVAVATHEFLQWLRRGGGGEGVLVQLVVCPKWGTSASTPTAASGEAVELSVSGAVNVRSKE